MIMACLPARSNANLSAIEETYYEMTIVIDSLKADSIADGTYWSNNGAGENIALTKSVITLLSRCYAGGGLESYTRAELAIGILNMLITRIIEDDKFDIDRKRFYIEYYRRGLRYVEADISYTLN